MSTTSLSDFTVSVRQWINIKNTNRLPDSQIIEWIRMAEERINNELRCRDMVSIERSTFFYPNSILPPRFLQLEYIKPQGGYPYKFVNQDEYNDKAANPTWYCDKYYTIIGSEVFIFPAPDPDNGLAMEVAVLMPVPPLADDSVDVNGNTIAGTNWLNDNYPMLYKFAALSYSSPFLVEDDRYITWQAEATRMIGLMNQQYKISKLGNGPLKSKIRGFG